MHPSLTVFDNEVAQYIHTDFEIETLTNDCGFTEGPVWNADGFYLFSDIEHNVVYKIFPGKKKSVFIDNSGTENINDPDLKPGQIGSNGLAYDVNGQLLVCRHGSHCVSYVSNNVLQPLFETFENRPFNSPNDIVVHKNGSIYFSDPPYGLKDGQLNPKKFQPQAAVYCFRNGALKIICNTYQYPNGVCLSANEKLLYICSNKPFEKFISLYDTETNAFIKTFAEENSDGIKCDRNGNVYLCSKDGIIILNNTGKRLALIALPTQPANICWGGSNTNDLFITARENIFLIRNLQK